MCTGGSWIHDPLKSSVAGPSLLGNCYLESNFTKSHGDHPLKNTSFLFLQRVPVFVVNMNSVKL